MKRAVLVLMTMGIVFALVGGTASAQPGNRRAGQPVGRSVARPTAADAAAAPTAGLTAPVQVRNGKPVPQGRAGRRVSAAAASTPGWIDGTTSNTYFHNIITGGIMMLTTQWVGYWGAEDASYPKIGELYYGHSVIAVVGTIGTPVVPNVVLPPNTQFSIDPANPNQRIRCFLENFQTGANTELTGANCPQTPTQGLYGAQFAPQAAFWRLSPGQLIHVVFPVFSSGELRGIAAAPVDCMVGSTWAAGSIEIWDAPGPTDRCPLPKDHGVWQGVWVSFNPPTVGYPTPSSTNVTTTSARTMTTLFSHFDPGTAFVEMGTTTAYGMVSPDTIPNTHDSFTISTEWSGLTPATTYHWRLRFVDQQGRTFVGADQTLRTAAPPPDTTAPRVLRVLPVESATGVAPGANLAAVFTEAILPETITATTIKLIKLGSTAPVAAVVRYDPVAKRATIDPQALLERGATYRVTIGAAARDLARNSLDQNPAVAGNQAKIWTFTVRA